LRSSRFSLGTGYLIKERQSAMRTFMSPAVIRSVIVFFLSAIALFPSHQARFFAALIGGTNSIGAVVSPYITIQVVRTDMTNYIEDYLAGLWLAAWPRLPRAARGRRVDLFGKGFWAEFAGRGSFCYWRSSTSATPGT
jgi:hypothetical protein